MYQKNNGKNQKKRTGEMEDKKIGKESLVVAKEYAETNDVIIAMFTLDQIILVNKARTLFDFSYDDMTYCMGHDNIINGLNRMIKLTKEEGCTTQTITQKIILGMEMGIILNLLNRQKEKDYAYKINTKAKTLEMKLICEDVSVTLFISEKLIKYRMIISALDYEPSFCKNGEDEIVYTMKGEILHKQ